MVDSQRVSSLEKNEVDKLNEMLDIQIKYLKDIKSKLKSNRQLEVYRNRSWREYYDLVRVAWFNNTINNTERKKLVDRAKQLYSYDNLCGVKQLSIFDLIPEND